MRPEFGIGPQLEIPNKYHLGKIFKGRLTIPKIIFLTKETLFCLCSLHCLGVVDFLEGDALQANLQLAILLGPSLDYRHV